MQVTFNHRVGEKVQTLRCESLSVYLSTRQYKETIACIEFAGSATAIRACWSNIVEGRRGDVEDTGIVVEVAGEKKTLAVTRESKFTRKNVSQNQLIVINKDFQAAKRTMIFGGTYEEPSPYFSDMVRINLIQIPFKPEWIPQMWRSAIEQSLVKPMLHYGEGPNAWDFSTNDRDPEAHIEKWKTIIKEIVLCHD